MTSTAHYIFGWFKEVMDNADEYGFKVYRWSIAKHESGVTNPHLIYKYKTGWKPNVPWVTQDAIDFLRKTSSDDEWLVEALGGVATLSGSVINPEDLTVSICSKCELEDKPCEPYQFPDCKLITEKQFKSLTERKLGIDWGDIAPNAFTVVGRGDMRMFMCYSIMNWLV